MKSVFVTFLSGLLIYAGYYFHPICHRIGNQIGDKLKAEFVPVSESSEFADRNQNNNVKSEPEQQNNPENVNSDQSVITPENNDEEAGVSADEPPETINDSGENKEKQPVVTPYTKPYANPIVKEPHKRKSPIPSSNKLFSSAKKKITFPPKYDLYSAIKKGIDVQTKTNEYNISDRDKKIGRELAKIEEYFDKKYNGAHLTTDDIEILQEEHDKAIGDLAEKYGLSKSQLIIFGQIIKRHL